MLQESEQLIRAVSAAQPPSDDASTSAVARVVICGSFRRGREELLADYYDFRALGCEVLSPLDPKFVDDRDGFVVAEHERDLDPALIEAGHLEAMEAADFVWLHAPDGYVGTSAAMELGFARASGIRVFTRAALQDRVFDGFVVRVEELVDAIGQVVEPVEAPAQGLLLMQAYYRRAAAARGYNQESPQDTMLLFTEEVGELARAVRKHVGLIRETGYADTDDAAMELADVQLYLLHLANVVGVDLAAAVVDKERVNAARSAARLEAQAA